jgi:hypothetical protein
VTLYETEEIFAQDFENHANMNAIRTFMTKMIQKGDDMGSSSMGV